MLRMKDVCTEEIYVALQPLEAIWKVRPTERSSDGMKVAARDEEFHCNLVAASKNPEFVRVHLEVTEKIRIVRRLDFTQPSRITATYEEHAAMLRALLRQAFEVVAGQLATHIEASRSEARKITLSRLQNARKSFKSQKYRS